MALTPGSSPPPPPALSLAWAPGGPSPAWLVACAPALQALQAQPGQPGLGDIVLGPAHGRPGPARLQRLLHLSPAPEHAPADAPPAWWLTDGQGQALDAERPLLADITAGQGLSLALWQPAPQPVLPSAPQAALPGALPGAGWVCVRRLHIDTGSHYGRALQALPQALARLLWQAGRDLLLAAAPSAPVHPRPCGTGLKVARRRQRWPAALLPLRGHWRAWLALQRARWCRESWRIGIIDQPLAALTHCRQPLAPRWLPESSALGYWADPAGQAGSDSRILAEYFDEHSGRGHIEQLRLNGSGVSERQVLPLGEGRHASFPLAVQLNGRWLGLAETAALRRCELHEIDAQGQWRPLATLLPGVAAADPALFQWEGRYWLACTDIDQGAMDNLCLYHAEQPEGPWHPHANNPVKVDVTGARMAGALFWHEGQLYRPAQNCLGTYGAGVVLHRVLQCSPTQYVEETVREIHPDPSGPCPHGLHTLNAWGDRTLIDGKRHVFSLGLGLLKLRRRLARWRGLNAPAGGGQ